MDNANAYQVKNEIQRQAHHTTRTFVFCNLSYVTKKSHTQLFWNCMRHFLVA